MRWKWLGSWRTAAETLVVVAVLVGLKLAVYYLGWEFISVNTLFTSVIGGAIFLFSLILAGTLADFKEGERFPAEMVAACEGIFEDGQFVKATHPEFDLERLRSTILGVVDGFTVDAGDLEARQALGALSGLQASFLEMEALGVPPNYIIRLKGEEGSLRKGLLRMYHIQRTSFLPLAYTLVKSLVVLLLGMLLFSRDGAPLRLGHHRGLPHLPVRLHPEDSPPAGPALPGARTHPGRRQPVPAGGVPGASGSRGSRSEGHWPCSPSAPPVFL